MRGRRNFAPGRPYASMEDRIISGLTCLTWGLVGFIWIIISHIRGQSLSSFSRFHIFQSIMIFIGIYVLGLILSIFLGFIQLMPFVGPFVANIVYFVSGYPLVFGLSATTFFVQALAVYMAVFSFMGKYAEVPGISNYIRRMV